jgi:bacteriocin biosynthesis cyclodehydratase domain-containing protein
MPDYYRLKAHFAYQVLDANSVYVYSETASFHLSGRAYPALLPLLQGGLSERALLAEPPAGLTMVELIFALGCMQREQMISHFPPVASARDALFWDSLGQDAAQVVRRLQRGAVALLDLTGQVDMPALAGALARHGIAVRPGGEADMQVVLVDDYLDPRLAEINRLNLARQLPWLLAKPSGALMWVGPLMVRGVTACWRCMRHRLHHRRKLRQYLDARLGGDSAAARQVYFSCAADLALASICAEVVKFIALRDFGDPSAHVQSMHHVLTIDALTYQYERHAVIRRPQCDCCGDAGLIAKQQSRALVLDTDAALRSRNAGLRLRSAEEVHAALQRHISPITGIIGVTRIVTQAGDVQGVTSSVAAEHNFSLIDNDSSFLQERIRSCAGGKGTTLIQAQASALCESIERYSGMYQGDEQRIASTFAALPNAIHPNDCLLFSDSQYRDRARINASASRIGQVPQPFDPSMTVDWTPLWSLTHRQFYYLPTSYCFYGYAREHHCGFARADSNGCAAGSTLAEAVLQGFLELVERDAAALWWYNRSVRCGVDWQSFKEPYLDAVAQYYAGCGRSFWILDITSDLDIPCFAALCARPGAPAEEITFAFGAHLDARIALLRAVSELNQIMPNLVNDPAASLQSLGGEALRWWQQARLAEQPYLMPGGQTERSCASYPEMSGLTLAQALQACLDCAGDKSLNVLVLDQSRPDADLAVVRVVVPSLRHFWPRFAPGRLYTCADAVGDEAALNPYPIFI